MDEQREATDIVLSRFQVARIIVADIKKQILNARALNDRTEQEAEEFKLARMVGQCQGMMDCVLISIEALEERLEDGISAAKFLS